MAQPHNPTGPRSGPKRLPPIMKGEILRRMEQLARDRAVVSAMLRGLMNEPERSLVDLAIEHGYIKNSDEEAGHIRNDWFSPEGGWFPQIRAVEPVIRAGFIKAGELVLEHRLPVDAYVVAGYDRVEVVVCKSDQQITILVLCPQLPIAPGEAEAPGLEEIWVARAKPSGEPEVVLSQIRP